MILKKKVMKRLNYGRSSNFAQIPFAHLVIIKKSMFIEHIIFNNNLYIISLHTKFY